MKKVSLVLAILSGVNLWSQAANSPEEWLKALGSENYENRAKVMDEIWEGGDESLDFLKELAEGDDPELAARAERLSHKIRSGIKPDTPEKIVELVEKYFRAKRSEKMGVVNALKDLEAYEFIVRLKLLETDEDTLAELAEMVAEVLPRFQLKLLGENRIEEAKKILLLSHDFDSLIAYANLCEVEGSLDAEISRLQSMDGEKNEARYLACLRVKGDPEFLLKEGLRLGDQYAVSVAALVLGDAKPIFELLKKNGGHSLSDQRFIDWNLANLKGDEEEAKRCVESLRHNLTVDAERRYARANLMRMGLVEDVTSSFTPKEDGIKYSYYSRMDDYEVLMDLVKLTEPRATHEWLEKVYKEAVQNFDHPSLGDPGRVFERAATFFENRGMEDDAARCLMKYFDALRIRNEKNIRQRARDFYGGIRKGSLIAFAREIDQFEANAVDICKSIFDNGIDSSDALDWLLVKLMDGADERPTLELLQLVASFYGEPQTSVEVFEKVEKALREETLAEQDKVTGLKHLYAFAIKRSHTPDVLLYLSLLEEAGSPVNPLNAAIGLGILGQNYATAEQYAQVSLEDFRQSSSDLYRAALIMEKVHDPKAAEFFKWARLFSQGNGDQLRLFAAGHLDLGQPKKAYALYQKAILREEKLSIGNRGFSHAILMNLSSMAMQARDWKKALAYKLLFSWETNVRYYLNVPLHSRHAVLICQGMVALQEGRREDAIADLTAAHGLIPEDGSLADDFFPILREAGLIELHDQLFERTAAFIRKNLEIFPADHNLKNTYAWIASRANRRLDEVESLLKESLAVRPRSSAYLDTMGEIYFARRNRTEAVRWSDLSLENEMRDAIIQARRSYPVETTLRSQNRRFRFAPFPVP